MNIPILMRDVPRSSCDYFEPSNEYAFFGAEDRFEIFGETARALLNRLLHSLSLNRGDVISILTTSDELYVSTCVSVTAFNYAGISRQIEEATKVVIVIHEFGYAYPNIDLLANKLAERSITLIEDCAHVIGLAIDNGLSVGSYGDFSIFSLPKISAMRSGGLLRAKANSLLSCFESSPGIKECFLKEVLYWQDVNAKRLDRYNLLNSLLGRDRILTPSSCFVPFFVYVTKAVSHSTIEIQNVEFGATLRTDIVLVPVNPLVDLHEYEELSIQLNGV